MAIRKIAQLGHPVLRQRAQELPAGEIPSAAIQRLMDDMVETMRDAGGAGLAAPQVHESLRIAAIEVGDNPRYPDLPGQPLLVLVNPIITPLVDLPLRDQDSVTMYEGCLSVHGLRGRVRRPRKIRVQGLDRDGAPFDRVVEGLHRRSAFGHRGSNLLRGAGRMLRELWRDLLLQRGHGQTTSPNGVREGRPWMLARAVRTSSSCGRRSLAALLPEQRSDHHGRGRSSTRRRDDTRRSGGTAQTR